MKTKKKISTHKDNLDTIISKGKAEVEKKGTKRLRGRPKNKSAKIQCLFYLPTDLSQAIDDNCAGNKSVFAEKVFGKYFDLLGVKY